MLIDPSSRRLLVLASCLVAALPAVATERYTGSAYARGSDTVLYREIHLVDASRHVILYQCPDGKAFARKRLQINPSPTQPDFEFKDASNGYEEGVRHDGAKRIAYVRRVDGQRSEHPLSIDANTVIDAGFDDYVKTHWDELVKGATSVPFLMTGRGRVFPVKVSAAAENNGARRIELRLDAWYGFAAPTITVTYTSSDHRLLRYEGPGTIRDARGKPMDVRIEFPPADRKDGAPANALDSALAVPLDGRCGN